MGSPRQGNTVEPISQHDIEDCCRRLLEAYGAAALTEVRSRRDRLLAGDDPEGFLVWWRIERAMGELTRGSPR